MFETAIKLTELPWATVLTLAAGYCGYFVAHVGARSHHQTADVVFGTLAFGFWGLFAYQYFQAPDRLNLGPVPASVSGFAVSIGLGGAWSGFGRRWFDRFLRRIGVTLRDDCPSAWAALGRDPNVVMTQLTVKLSCGDIYLTDDLSRFKDMPNGPCTFGGAGDMIMFVTHVCYADSEVFEGVDMSAAEKLGYEATYIPKEQIARVEFRQTRRASLLRRANWRRIM
ncbi:hypothetical protein [Paracoccus denitrificans]|uniref:hypothetical protein n=1 Tax=Paracoccus denitrificans TaxID=266 RepID=UPI001319BA51|nr:hypothetical protein [Paracoccus denitrificans]